MAMSTEEGKAKRRAGLMRERSELTRAQKVHRSLVNGRPPASEMKTPQAALMAARTLQRELESRLTADGLPPKPGHYGVSIGYISPDLSALGFTPLISTLTEAQIMGLLDNEIMLGLIFGLVDLEAENPADRIVLGVRAFITTKQVEPWLEGVVGAVRLEIEDAFRMAEFAAR